MSKDKKIRLIQRLLAKAESTTPEEAEALTAAAEKLMLRLGIDDAMLNATQPDSSPLVSKQVIFRGRYAAAEVDAAMAVIGAFGTCYPLYSRSGNWGCVTIHGRESQVDRMVLIVESLRLQAMAGLSVWWRTAKRDYARAYYTEQERFLARRSYVAAFGDGAATRVRSEKATATAETAGSALVLRDEQAAAEEWARSRTKVRSGRVLRRDYAGEKAGFGAGITANVGTTQLAEPAVLQGIGAR